VIGASTSNSKELESPFDHVVEDDSAVTVPELVVGIAAAANGLPINDRIIIASEGHLELAEDSVQVMEEDSLDTTGTSIGELEKVVYGRGKRHQIKSHRYGHDFEEH
jgi:hypothetical protein